MNELYYLRDAAREAGMTVKRVFDNGKEVEGEYELRKGNYTQMVGDCNAIMDVIKHSPEAPNVFKDQVEEIENREQSCDKCRATFPSLDSGADLLTVNEPVEGIELCEECYESHEVECDLCGKPVLLKDAGHIGEGVFTKYHHDECWDFQCREEEEESRIDRDETNNH